MIDLFSEGLRGSPSVVKDEALLAQSRKRLLDFLVWMRFPLAGIVCFRVYFSTQTGDIFRFAGYGCVVLYLLYCLLLLLLRKKPGVFYSDRFMTAESVFDSLFIASFYILSQDRGSNWYLLFAVPILLASFRKEFIVLTQILMAVFIAVIMAASLFVLFYAVPTPFVLQYFETLLPMILYLAGAFILSAYIFSNRSSIHHWIKRSSRTENARQAILNSMGEYIFAINRNHEILWANEKFKKDYFEKYNERMKATRSSHCFSEYRDRDQVCGNCLALKAMESGETHSDIEVWVKKGIRSIFQVKATPLLNETGETIGAVETLLDVTEQEGLKRLLEQQGYILKIIESSADAIIVTDKRGLIQLCNQGACRLLEYDDFELSHLSCKDIYSTEEGDGGYAIALDIMERLKNSTDGRIFNYSTNLKSKSEEIIHITLSASLIYNEHNEVIAVVGITRDMRELDKLEAEKLRNEKFAVIGGIASYLAHKVKGNLGTLQFDIESLQESTREQATEIEEKQFKKCLRILKTIDNIIKDILAASTPTHLSTKIIGFGELQSHLEQEFKAICIKKKINFDINLNKKLPNLQVDIEQLMQVFYILLNNSFDALELIENAVITVRSREEEGRIYIQWSDNGHGIPEELHYQVFDPFVTTKEKGKGWGMGLAIARNLLNLHGGSISIDQKSRKGATFLLSLPKA
ncbi:MAG: PAS domain-containing protein [bacterium]|nr:PAS domain-containing protein [bacterium]